MAQGGRGGLLMVIGDVVIHLASSRFSAVPDTSDTFWAEPRDCCILERLLVYARWHFPLPKTKTVLVLQANDRITKYYLDIGGDSLCGTFLSCLFGNAKRTSLQKHAHDISRPVAPVRLLRLRALPPKKYPKCPVLQKTATMRDVKPLHQSPLVILLKHTHTRTDIALHTHTHSHD